MRASIRKITLDLALLLTAASVGAQNTAMTYQGHLTTGNTPANGLYDFQFMVIDTASGGGGAWGPVLASAVPVSNGLFTATLDFGADPFRGGDRWLEIQVRTNGAGGFSLLQPRQQLTSAPHAVYALLAESTRASLNNTFTNSAASGVAAGVWNTAGDFFAFVGGGSYNGALGGGSFVGGGGNGGVNPARGFNNIASGFVSAVVGGFNNTASGRASFVGCGEDNVASGVGAFVGGGSDGGGGLPNNVASGASSMIPGGLYNTAAGNYSLAAGYHAEAMHNGAFVWGDSSSASDFASTANNQFLIRAAGGVGINKNNPAYPLDVAGTVRATSFVGSGSGLSGVAAASLAVPASLSGNTGGAVLSVANSSGGGYGLYASGNYGVAGVGPNVGVYAHNTSGTPGRDVYLATAGLAGDFYGDVYVHGTVTQTSDRNAKENFKPLDRADVLQRVCELPVTRWTYKGASEAVHIGPVAQDFHAAFNVGLDDKSIAPLDAAGVSLAAIQGLNQKLEEQLKTQSALLKSQQGQIKALLERLETLEALARNPSAE